MENIVVLDYGTGDVTIIQNVSEEIIEQQYNNDIGRFVEDQGFKESECSYMYGVKSINFKDGRE